jgi:hypothetical protein
VQATPVANAKGRVEANERKRQDARGEQTCDYPRQREDSLFPVGAPRCADHRLEEVHEIVQTGRRGPQVAGDAHRRERRRASPRQSPYLVSDQTFGRRGDDVENGPQKGVHSAPPSDLPDEKPEKHEKRHEAEKQPKGDRGRRLECVVDGKLANDTLRKPKRGGKTDLTCARQGALITPDRPAAVRYARTG